MGGDKIEKITIMVLKVDLQCSSCYKKVKKVLCKFPQIRDQEYDEKANSVTVKIFSCNPEKIRDKLCYEGGGVITSIEIKKPIVPEPGKSTDPKPGKAKSTDPKSGKTPEPNNAKPPKPKDEPKPTQPQPQPQIPSVFVMQIQGYPHQYPPAPEPVIVTPIQVYPHQSPPRGYCCDECYQGSPGGPCYHHDSYRRPIPPRAHCYSYGYGPGPVPYGLPNGCYVNKCDYFSEENASGCSIM